jgi:hypothetical protein
VWEVDGREVAVLKGDGESVSIAAFSPDGKRVIMASNDVTAWVWEADGREVTVLKGHRAGVLSVAFSPDGKHIVTASADGTARVWDADGGEVAVLKGHFGFVSDAAFSPDGERIVTASYTDQTARVWRVDGREVAVLRGHTAGVWSATFSPDGKRIVTASEDGTARVWSALPTNALVDHAKAVVPRCLTEEQRREFGLASEPPQWCRELGKWPYTKGAANTIPPNDKQTPERWMDRWMAVRLPVGPLHIARFKDPIYVLTRPIGWKPNTEQDSRLKMVEVPKGFVTDFASIPWQFWSMLRPDGDYAYAAVIHDYLYWTQQTSREIADEIFYLAMLDFKIDSPIAHAIYYAVRLGGEPSWKENAALKARGERRVLKILPDDPRVTWAEWKTKPGVFEYMPISLKSGSIVSH